MRVLRRNSIPEWMRAGVPKKAWLKFPLRLYGWADKHARRNAQRFLVAQPHSCLLRALSCKEAVERQKYINTAAPAQCRELRFEKLARTCAVRLRRRRSAAHLLGDLPEPERAQKLGLDLIRQVVDFRDAQPFASDSIPQLALSEWRPHNF